MSSFSIKNTIQLPKKIRVDYIETGALDITNGGDFKYTMPSAVLVSDGVAIETDFNNSINTPVKASITSNTSSFLNEMTIDGVNRITYTGNRSRPFAVNISIGATLAAATGNNRLCNFHIYRDGISIPTSVVSSNIREGNQVINLSTEVPIIMNKGQYIELWCENTEFSSPGVVANVIIQTMTIVCIGMSYVL